MASPVRCRGGQGESEVRWPLGSERVPVLVGSSTECGEEVMPTTEGHWEEVMPTTEGQWEEVIPATEGQWEEVMPTTEGHWEEVMPTTEGHWEEVMPTTEGHWEEACGHLPQVLPADGTPKTAWVPGSMSSASRSVVGAGEGGFCWNTCESLLGAFSSLTPVKSAGRAP
ncbi:unnamed protein product [Rangifer tarandus platyrhynchus]|uniref:Uncharacterized protein n=2 Tax=Rangifer tarandus platyrhynchus TaxID=3082113 RepID=A0ACB0FJP5_RANTA|nr:unnamed protein product [Rangifer tarandus platyrhynchus]CAI9713290.1 unnamed protein product [Rangifer tarandus platyrhynchus]